MNLWIHVIGDEMGRFMMRCETCGVWQHGPCLGYEDEAQVPINYYCDHCRPDLHPIYIKT
jgi:hypothetical protein